MVFLLLKNMYNEDCLIEYQLERKFEREISPCYVGLDAKTNQYWKYEMICTSVGKIKWAALVFENQVICINVGKIKWVLENQVICTNVGKIKWVLENQVVCTNVGK